MATSKPEFQGIVLKDSGVNYCGLFKSRVVPVSGSPATQYYWFPTNSSGDIMDYRDNELNGTFTSDTNALANYPSGYGNYVDNWPTTKYLSYTNLYPFDGGNTDNYLIGLNEWVTADSGINNILVPIYWTDVFDSYNSTGRRQDQNLNASWSKVDAIVIAAKNKGVKVSLLIGLHLSSRNPYAPSSPPLVDSFYGVSNYEKDENNNPIAVGTYGDGHPSLADETSTSGRSMMKDFFQKVVTRYGGTTGQTYSLGTQLNWVTLTITGQLEYGYNYDNTVSGISANALSGYSTATLNGFRGWLFNASTNPDKYADLTALNSAWGTAYGTIGAIMPPTTGKAFGTAVVSDFAALFQSNRGKDWWKYLAYLLYKFANDCKAITANATSIYAPQTKFVVSFGGVSPNDDYVIMRGTYDVLSWGNYSDGMKTAFGIDPRNQTSSLTLDYVQAYPGKKMTELHYIDYTDPSNPESTATVKQRMIDSGTAAIKNGCRDLLFISMPQHAAYYTMAKEVLAGLKGIMAQNHDSSRQTANRVASFTLGELLNSGGRYGKTSWQNVGGNNESRVKIIFSNTINPSTSDLPYTLSLNDVSTFYFRQNEMKNSYFWNNPSVQADYIANKVGMLVSTHGIDYKHGTPLTRSNITIKSKTTNIVWLKMIQSRGVTEVENNYAYNNNHPEKRDISTLSEDCRFWFPKDDYDITIEVFDAGCYFSVMNPNVDAPNRFVQELNVAAGASYTITVLKSTMDTQENMDWRLIKINNNRYVSTP
jgi:hypothetical protein